jgi:hypothetical protein
MGAQCAQFLDFALCFLAFQANAQDKIPYALRAFRECEYFIAFFLGAETNPQDLRSSVKQTCGKHLEDDPSVGLSVDRAIDIFMPTYEAILAKHKQMFQRREP